MRLQEWIHHWEVGAGAKLLRVLAAVLGFVAVAGLVDALAYPGLCFTSEEAMETAQLARNISRGRGYTTESVRPLAAYLIGREANPGEAAGVLRKPVPDVSNAPAYPALLAGLMSILPFDYVANDNQDWFFTPDRWIGLFNQFGFFLSAVLLYFTARRLFDARVAWMSAALFACTNLYWRFTFSGVSTSWLVVIFLGGVMGMIQFQERRLADKTGWGTLGVAAWIGAAFGLAALTRYAMAWMLIPVLVFMSWTGRVGRAKYAAVTVAAFLAVTGPWIARNIILTGTAFGTAGYAVLDQTGPFFGDALERSFDPAAAAHHVSPLEVIDKFLANGQEIWRNELPRMGGSWVSAFFLVGLFIPFRSPALSRFRVFVLISVVLLYVAQAAGQTHLSSDSPEFNSENLLVIIAPLVLVFGVALFYTLLDQLHIVALDARGAIVGAFVLVSCAPLAMAVLHGYYADPETPYSPPHIQRVAKLMRPDEFMISDVPGAVAWYGDRTCGWLPLDDDHEFYQFNGLRPIKGVFLTQKTMNSRYLTQMVLGQKSWERFAYECESQGQVPPGFPLTKAPKQLLPYQILVSDQARWRLAPESP